LVGPGPAFYEVGRDLPELLTNPDQIILQRLNRDPRSFIEFIIQLAPEPGNYGITWQRRAAVQTLSSPNGSRPGRSHLFQTSQ